MRYRFLAGRNIRPTLQELRVGGDGYEIKEVNGDYFLRHGKGLLALTKKEFDTYFEPFVDYGVEGDGKYEDPKPMIKQLVKAITKEKLPVIPLVVNEEGQLQLF